LDKIEPSERNELEITDLIEEYMSTEKLEVKHLSRGTAWFDAGTPERLFMAADYVRIMQERSGEIVGSPEEVSVRNGLLPVQSFKEIIQKMPESNYKESLISIELLKQDEIS
jgi:glucose-1-phosphate thymidylyltransferase